MEKLLPTALAVAVGVIAVSSASGQRQDETPREQLTAAGSVMGYSGGLLYVMTKEGDQYRVKPPANPMYVSYVASATTDFLQRGMPVKFTAKFNDKGKAVAPVRDITIYTPDKENPFGVYADSGLGGTSSDLFSTDDTNQNQPEGRSYIVRGTIAKAKFGKLEIAAGRASVEVKLADDARVSVEVSHLNFMRQGDNVSIEGWYNPVQKRDVVANKLTVSAAGTLGESGKKPVE